MGQITCRRRSMCLLARGQNGRLVLGVGKGRRVVWSGGFGRRGRFLWMGLRGMVGMFCLVVEEAWWCFDGWKTLLDVDYFPAYICTALVHVFTAPCAYLYTTMDRTSEANHIYILLVCKISNSPKFHTFHSPLNQPKLT